MRSARPSSLGLLAIGLVAGVPNVLLACPVCFGQNDSPLAVAMNNGILLMLGVIVAVLACFAAFFIHLIRRARFVELNGELQATPFLGVPQPGQEGAASC